MAIKNTSAPQIPTFSRPFRVNNLIHLPPYSPNSFFQEYAQIVSNWIFAHKKYEKIFLILTSHTFCDKIKKIRTFSLKKVQIKGVLLWKKRRTYQKLYLVKTKIQSVFPALFPFNQNKPMSFVICVAIKTRKKPRYAKCVATT